MKRILAVVAVGILIISSFGAIAISNRNELVEEKEIVFSSEPTIIDHESSCSIILPEADTYLKNPGQPVLPVIIKTYTFPIGTVISQVTCQPINIQEETIEKEITYAAKPAIRSSSIKIPAKSVRDDTVYNSDAFYPDTWYDYNIGVGLDGKEHVTYVTIQLYPVRYSPRNQVIKYANNVDITVQYNSPTNPIVFPDEFDLMVIAPRLFSGKLQRLVDHKEDMGVRTKLITTQEIYRTYEGRDRQEKIKYCIKEAFEEWGIDYVLLFGGMKGQRFWSWHVPAQYSHLDDASQFEDKYLSDLYYADFYKYDNATGYTFDDWDSNDNGICAEWNSGNKDVLDMFPDVCIGRLPCRYRFEVDRIIDRIITYETTCSSGDWFNTMVGIGGDSFDDISWPTSTDYIEGQETTALALSFMDGFEGTRIWVEGGDVQLSTENILNELNKGQGFVYFAGHGNPMTWSTHPHGDFSTWIGFSKISIEELQNGDKLSVLIVGGCHNSQFDVSIFKIISQRARMWGEATTECWGWLFASLPDGGCIASIGSSGLGYGTIGDGPDPPDEKPDSVPDGIPDCIQYLGGWIESHFYEVYNHQEVDILGETHSQTLTDYLNQFPIDWDMNWEDHEQSGTLVDCKTVQEWVLFGDPSLKIGGY